MKSVLCAFRENSLIALDTNLIKADYWEIDENCREHPYEYIDRRNLIAEIEINGFKGAEDKWIGYQKVIFIPRADGTKMIIESYNEKEKKTKSVEKIFRSAREAISVYERGFKAKDGNKLPILFSVEIASFESDSKKKNLTLLDTI